MNEYEKFRNNRIIKNAEREMKECKHPYVGTEHLLLSLLKEKEVVDVCSKYGLTYANFKKELLKTVGSSSSVSPFILHTPLLKLVVSDAIMDAKESKEEVTAIHLLVSLLENGDGIALRLLINMGISVDNLYNELNKKQKLLNSKIDFGTNLGETINLDEKVIGRENELTSIIEIMLRKNKNNPILVGPAGVGKTAIVEELARRIKKGEVPLKIRDYSILSLELSRVVAGTKYRGEFEEKLKNIIDSVINEKVILFIDEIHCLVHAGGSEGAIDAANILKPYLSRGSLKIIGATTINEYNKFIKKDKALERRFQLVNVKEPNLEETIKILSKIKNSYENFYTIHISNNNIKDIVYLTDKYVKHKQNPDKSLEVLDSVCSKLSLKEINKIKKDDILEKICQMYSINNNSFNFKALKRKFKESLIGQDNVCDKIIQLLNVKKDKPISVLLCGSSGVGKTKTASILSEILGMPLIKLDMSEYMNESSINKLIGTSAGYVGYDDDFIFDKIRYNPNSIILLDEVEKGSKKILNLFLNILDEGIIFDSKGEIIDFSNCVIILTSNLKQECKIGFMKKMNNNRFFSDEFLARLDEIIYFNDIDENMIKEYLIKKNSCLKTSDIINECDYKKLGFRGIEKYLKSREKILK